MDIEVIDVDAFEPEITVGRQGKRTLRAVLIPSGQPRPKPKPEEIIDLTADDDEDLHVRVGLFYYLISSIFSNGRLV